MQKILGRDMTVAHVPETGHTPALADNDSISLIRSWVVGQKVPSESTLPCRSAPIRLLFTNGMTDEETIQPRIQGLAHAIS
jgi:hypothetical protein